MRSNEWRWLATGGFIVALMLASCSASSGTVSVPAEDMIDSGSWYSRVEWPHDGNPIETEHFVVYSDAASPEARLETAELSEVLWAQVLTEFDVEESDLIFPPDRDKIDIYVYKNRDPDPWSMRAYQAGFIAWSLDNDNKPTAPKIYVPTVKHELVHVLETLLKGRDSTIEPMTDAWFSEGLAEAVVGGNSGGPILGRDQLSSLLAGNDNQNPVALKRDTWYENVDEFHYPMFQLAVDYLLDSDGGGRTLQDARDLFIAMADGTTTFERAFNATMGTTLYRYETEFFVRIEPFLPAYRNPLYSPFGVGAIGIAIAGSVFGILVRSGRRNRRNASTGARIAFYSSTALGGLVTAAAAFFLLMLLGFNGSLYNRTMNLGRKLSTALVVVFLIAAISGLTWVQRRWNAGSRLAYLGLPMSLVLFGANFGLIVLVVYRV